MDSKNEPQAEYFVVPTNVDPNWIPLELEKMAAAEAEQAAKAAADAKAEAKIPKKWTCRLRERVVCARTFPPYTVNLTLPNFRHSYSRLASWQKEARNNCARNAYGLKSRIR